MPPPVLFPQAHRTAVRRPLRTRLPNPNVRYTTNSAACPTPRPVQTIMLTQHGYSGRLTTSLRLIRRTVTLCERAGWRITDSFNTDNRVPQSSALGTTLLGPERFAAWVPTCERGSQIRLVQMQQDGVWTAGPLPTPGFRRQATGVQTAGLAARVHVYNGPPLALRAQRESWSYSSRVRAELLLQRLLHAQGHRTPRPHLYYKLLASPSGILSI